MYGLASDVDLGFMNGAELLQICIGVHQVILNFQDEISISIESEIESRKSGENYGGFSNLQESAVALVELLGQRVSDAGKIGEGDLRLTMADGDELLIRDSNKSFESYTINAKHTEIVV